MPVKRQRRTETRSQENESSDALDDAAFLCIPFTSSNLLTDSQAHFSSDTTLRLML
jgi:hypothetical protein